MVFVSCPGRGKESRECLYNLQLLEAVVVLLPCYTRSFFAGNFVSFSFSHSGGISVLKKDGEFVVTLLCRASQAVEEDGLLERERRSICRPPRTRLYAELPTIL